MFKPKILVVGPTPPPYGGMETATHLILQSELSQRYRILHLDTADRRPTKDNAGKLELINCWLGIKHSLKMLALLRRRPDLVYLPIAQNPWGYLRDSAFLILSRLFRRKVVVHLHGSSFKTFYLEACFFMKLLIRYTLKNIECAIVLGKGLRYIFTDFLPAERIKVVANGVDLRISDISSPSAATKSTYSILFLGILSEEKGVLDILRAVPHVREKRGDVKFILAGEWLKTTQRKAEDIIDRFSLHNFIEFPGPVYGSIKVGLLKKSDVFVFPSQQDEGQPFVILEAMAAGLPILTTESGTIGETVRDGENGLIIHKGNPRQMAEKILFLLGNHKIRQKMSAANRKRHAEKYTSKNFIRNLERVFHEALA